MRNSTFTRGLVAVLTVFLFGMLALAPAAVLAQDAEETVPKIQDQLIVNPKFPSMTGSADSTFKFEVEFTFRTADPVGKAFDLTVSGPSGWLTYIAESTYKLDSQISAIFLEPYSVKTPIVVVAVAPIWLYPEPGDYPIELQVSSGDLQETVNLTATITARYGLAAETTSGLLTTKTAADKSTTVGVNVTNSGTAGLDKVTLSAATPSGIANEEWQVTFDPETIENLAPGDSIEVQASITPPSKTVAGDYMVTLNFKGEPALSSEPPALDIRVSVATRTAWGVIGALIVVVVIGGLVWAFRTFGRR